MKKKILISLIIVIILLILVSLITLIFLEKRDDEVSLIQENITIEYGNIYNPNIEELIDLSKYNFINLEDIKIDNKIENEKDKNYPAVGLYEINVYYKDKVFKQNVEVKDTIAPELTIEENIELEYNTDISTIDFKKYANVTDLSETKTCVVDTSKIDSSVSGEYETNLSIEDIYGNKAQKKFKVKILEKPEEKIITKVEDKKKTTVSTKSNNTNTQPNTTPKVDENVKNTQTTNSSIESKKDEVVENTKKEEKKEIPKSNHDISFNSQDEVKEYWNDTLKEYSRKLDSGEIETYEEYARECPYGYECWTCAVCGKWLIRFYVG